MKPTDEMEGVFTTAQISLVYDIPTWEFLEVSDLSFFSFFKAKPIKDRLPDYPHTPAAGLERIFLS